jgi:hypothetical protein
MNLHLREALFLLLEIRWDCRISSQAYRVIELNLLIGVGGD